MSQWAHDVEQCQGSKCCCWRVDYCSWAAGETDRYGYTIERYDELVPAVKIDKEKE